MVLFYEVVTQKAAALLKLAEATVLSAEAKNKRKSKTRKGKG
jgi:hypothetical protein